MRPIPLTGALLATACLLLSACVSDRSASRAGERTPKASANAALHVTSRVRGTVTAPPVPPNRWLSGVDLLTASNGYLLSSRSCSASPSGVCTDLLATSDGGHAWHTLALDVPITDMQFVSAREGFGASPCRSGSSCSVRLFATGDGGRTWTRLESAVSLNASAGSPSIAFLADATGVVASGSDVFATQGGRSFARVFTCPDGGVAAAVAFAGPASRYVICAMQPGAGQQPKSLYVSTDGGAFHVLATLPEGGYAIPGSLYFSSGGTGLLSLQRGGLWRTTDGGRSYRFMSYVSGLAGASWASARQGLVIQAASVLATSDGGRTLQQVYPGLVPTGPLSMADAENGIAAQTEYNGSVLMQTRDGGASWRRIGQFGPDQLLRVSGSVLYATAPTQGGLYRSTDGGSTWSQLPVAGVPVFASFPTAEVGFVDLEADHLLRTEDGGRTWTKVETGQRVWNADFLDGRRGYALAAPSALIRTVDGGRTWTSVGTNPAWLLQGIDVVGDRAIFLSAVERTASGSLDGVLLSSRDGGINWRRIALGTPLANVDFVSPSLGFAEAGGGIVKTLNGGVTWQPVDAP